MSWLRFSDDFTEWPEWDLASTDVRWAYVCLVQAASRGQYWDGRLPKRKALAALVAQVDNPQQCLERLAMCSLVHELRSEHIVLLPRIHEHLPPPGVRKNAENSKIRMRRKRAHDAGDHTICLPSVVKQAWLRRSLRVTPGRDGTGRVFTPSPRPPHERDAVAARRVRSQRRANGPKRGTPRRPPREPSCSAPACS
jgi:hypothetical protein